MDPKITAAMAGPTMLVPPNPKLWEDQHSAKALVERLREEIAAAVEEAPEGHAVGVYCPIATGEQVPVQNLSWHNPDLVLVYSGDTRVYVHREKLKLLVRYVPVRGEVPELEIGFKPGVD